jgi:hypothetical protein
MRAYGGVVGHFVGHVLSASQSRRVNTDLGKEELGSGKEVTESLVVDDLLRNGVTDGHLGQVRLALHLNVLGQKGELDVLDLVESGVSLVKWVDVVLDLGHGELSIDQRRSLGRNRYRPPNTQETLLRGNLVSEGLANLSGSERDSAVVELEELGKVDEVALRRLRPEVTDVSGPRQASLRLAQTYPLI